MAELGCTVPWLPSSLESSGGSSNICWKDENSRKKAFELYQGNRRNQKNVCPNSCRFTNMYFGPPVTGVNNKEKQANNLDCL